MVCETSLTYFIINTASSAFSVLAIAIVTILFLLSRRIRINPSYRYIFYLLMADLIIALGGFLQPSSDIICRIAGLLREYAIISTLMWTVAFTLLVYSILENENLIIVKYEKRALLCCYGIPLLIAVPFVTFYGNSGFYCWLTFTKSDKSNMALNWLAIFGELIIGTLFIVYGLVKSYFLLKQQRYSASTMKIFYRMLYYPLILIVVNIIDIMDRVIQLEYQEECMTFLKMLHIITIQIQGFFNCICFCLNSSIRDEIYSLVRNRKDSLEKTSLLESSYIEYNEDSDIDTIPDVYDINEDLPAGPKRRFTLENE